MEEEEVARNDAVLPGRNQRMKKIQEQEQEQEQERLLKEEVEDVFISHLGRVHSLLNTILVPSPTLAPASDLLFLVNQIGTVLSSSLFDKTEPAWVKIVSHPQLVNTLLELLKSPLSFDPRLHPQASPQWFFPRRIVRGIKAGRGLRSILLQTNEVQVRTPSC